MDKFVFLLFDFIICAVEGYLYYNFCAHFLENRFEDEWKNMSVMAVGILVLYGINHYRSSALNLLMSGAIYFIFCAILFKDCVRKKLYTWFVSWFIMIGCEFVVAGILRLAWGDHAIIVTGAPIRVILSTIMMKILNLILFKLICSKTKTSKEDQYPAVATLFFFIPISSFIVCVGLCYLGESLDALTSNNMFLLFGCVLLLAANAVAFIIGDRLILAMNKVKEYEIMETKRQLEAVHYKAVHDMNENVKSILHNMNGVMQTLDALLQGRETEQMKQVLSDFRKELSDTEQTIYCGHPLIDAILSEKAKIAKEQNIEYQIFVEPGFNMIDMKSIDLISLISNLVDNAMEAAAKCDYGYVDVKMFRANDGDIIVLKFKNNYKELPVKCEGRFITSKEHPSMHGIGLRQVKKIVEQYKGNIYISHENYIFEVTINFFM